MIDLDRLTSAAAVDTAPGLLRETNWFVPDGQRNIDGMLAAQAFASLLGSALLGAMAKEVATRTVTWLAGQLEHLTKNAKAEPLPPEIADAAARNAKALAETAPGDRAATMAEAKALLVAELSKSMPPANAERIAGAVQEAIAKHAGA